MHRRDHCVGPRRVNRAPAVLHDAEALAEECFGRGGAERDDDARLHLLDLLLEPGEARTHLCGVRRLVDATLSLLIALPLEVLHRVRDVYVVAVDPRLLECAVQKLSRRTDKWMPRLVLRVSRLFADEHHA